ncbi:MAG: hypothetical protein GX130_04675 [Candidatus Hydrogenedens sp.]|jgi:hypothetical protein|nr:hypothetical protein [Candidatus Hydrogenedens sp.]
MKSKLICLLYCAAAAIAFLPRAEALPKNDLDRMLQGVTINTTFEECLQRLPDALYSDAELRETRPQADKPGALLIAHGTDPFLGVHAFANIGFQEEKVYELVTVWTGEKKDMEARCKRFLKALCKRHGEDFEKKSLFVYPDSEQEMAVAVWVWENEEAVSLAFYTPPSPDSTANNASLSFAQFKPDAEFLQDVFTKNPVPEEEARKAWEKMNKLIR